MGVGALERLLVGGFFDDLVSLVGGLLALRLGVFELHLVGLVALIPGDGDVAGVVLLLLSVGPFAGPEHADVPVLDLLLEVLVGAQDLGQLGVLVRVAHGNRCRWFDRSTQMSPSISSNTQRSDGFATVQEVSSASCFESGWPRDVRKSPD